MPRNRILASIAALVTGAVLSLISPASAVESPEALAAELDQVRQGSIAAARDMQQRQAAIAALIREIDLLDRDLAARRRGLAESQVEQTQLLGSLERLARHPPEQTKSVYGPPLDRVRSEILLVATMSALRTEAQALTGEIAAVASSRTRIAAKETELAGLRDALPKDRERLVQIVARRGELIRQLLPDVDKVARLPAKPDTADLDKLIEKADAAADKRDKALLARARSGLSKDKVEAMTTVDADPTRPKALRSFAAAPDALRLPVLGTILDGANSGGSGEGLHVATPAGAVVTAPFDGQIVYAGPFQPYVLVLILRHTDGYYCLLAGLGRADSVVGHWVLAGEPVGAMPDAAEPGSGGEIYVELRRNDGPVDPRPWLVQRDDSTGRGETIGDQRVRE